MFDKITDNMKFFIMMMIYVVYLTWWAATLNTTVAQQIVVSNKTIELLDAHIEECKNKDLKNIVLQETVKHLKTDVEHLMNYHEDGNGSKKGRN